MISVVIPLYNKASTIERCLASVLRQTVLPDELILVDDGSQDDGYDLAAQVLSEENEVSVLLLRQENSGVSLSRNRGAGMARNDFIAFLDADDEWHPDFIKVALQQIKEYPNAIFYTCKHEILDHEIGRFVPKQFFGPSACGLVENYVKAAKSFPLVNSSKVIVAKAPFLEAGGFPSGGRVAEDLFLWLVLSGMGGLAFSNRLLVTIHQAPDNSRSSRIGEVPYPIKHYSDRAHTISYNSELYAYLWSVHVKHVFASLAANKNEALHRIKVGYKLFKLRGMLLYLLVPLPTSIFKMVRIIRRLALVRRYG